MTNPDIRAAFEAWYAERHPNYPTSVHENPTWANASKMDDLEVWQACAASLSNSVAAGDRAPRKNLTLGNAPIGTKAPSTNGGAWYRTEHGWQWNNGSTFPRPGGDWNGELIAPAEAARQPAPVAVKTWQERAKGKVLPEIRRFITDAVWAEQNYMEMLAEIADLRAAIAATAAPVLSQAEIHRITIQEARKIGGGLVDEIPADDLTALGRAIAGHVLAATRSQP